MEFEWIQDITPLLVFVISWILIYVALKKLKVPANDWVLSILGIITSLIILTSEKSIDFLSYTFVMIPTILIVSFFLMLLLAFTAKDIEIFLKPIAWIIVIIAAIILIYFAFEFYPEIYNMMPGTSNSHLTSPARQFKDFIYSEEFVHNFLILAAIIIFSFVLIRV